MIEASDRTKPTGVTHDRQRHRLVVTWKDGHESIYDLDVLREICPCVMCRGGHDKMGPAHEPDVLTLTPAQSYELQKMELVGNYALQLHWGDGHNTGIYSWDFLRRNCPCVICTTERSEPD